MALKKVRTRKTTKMPTRNDKKTEKNRILSIHKDKKARNSKCLQIRKTRMQEPAKELFYCFLPPRTPAAHVCAMLDRHGHVSLSSMGYWTKPLDSLEGSLLLQLETLFVPRARWHDI